MPYTDKATLVRKGISAELHVAALLMEVGGIVTFPLLQRPPYDLIWAAGVSGEPFYRIQVKWAQYIGQRRRKHGLGDRACYRVDLSANGDKGHQRRYTPTSFDILAAVCSPALVYFLPVTKLLQDDGTLLRHVSLKVLDDDITRSDSIAAAQRWESYKGNVAAAQLELLEASQLTTT
jgi:hypothetical protein